MATFLRVKAPDPDGSAETNALFQRVFAAIELPTHYPAHGRLATDADGYLWVQDYAARPGAAAPEWQVFEPGGRWLGAVTLPQRFDIRRIERDEVLGVWRDALDVEHGRAYRLSRTARTR